MSTREAVAPSNGSYRLTTLGSAALWRVQDDGTECHTLGPGKPLAMLAYLALSPGRRALRDHLVDLLWSDAPARSGDQSMRQTLHSLRKLLGEHAFESSDGSIRLSISIETDRDAFLAAIDAGDLDRAVALYQGEFLPSLAVPGGADFEQWADSERRRLRLMFMRTGETLTKRWLAIGHTREAQRLARRVQDSDPDDERGWRLVLEALLSGNDVAAAAIEADAIEQLLQRDEREAEPSTATLLALARNAPQNDAPESPPLMAELIGRERAFATVLEAWEIARRTNGRHLHISAPPGIGKSRLLSEIHGRLRATGARVLLLKANAGQRQLPYALAAELAERLCQLPGSAAVSPGAAGLLVGLCPSISARLKASPDVQGQTTELLRRRSSALVEALEAVTDEAPIAMLLDDVHWADDESLQVVRAMAGRLATARLLLVSTARPEADGHLYTPDTESISLAPLTSEQLGAFMASLGDLPQDDWAVKFPGELHKATDGSPLLALEMIQHLCERDLLSITARRWHSNAPVALLAELGAGSALALRLSRLDRTHTWIVLLLSVAGMPLTEDQVLRASGQSREDTVAALQALEHRGLVKSRSAVWELSHDALATMSIDLASSGAVRAAHSAVGSAIAADSRADVSMLILAARHLLTSGNHDAVGNVFERCVAAARKSGDGRPAHDLARLLLGERADTGDIRRLSRCLPVRLRWRGMQTARTAATLAGVVLVSVTATVLVAKPRRVTPDATAVVIRRDGDGRHDARLIEVNRDGWPVTPDLDLDAGRPYRQPFFPEIPGEDIRRSADGTAWVFSRAVSDSGSSSDLFLYQYGRERRLTSTRGDDLNPSWSPDGRWIVFRTTRWNDHAWADLGLLDLQSGRTRQLTSGDSIDSKPVWSPDGSRIAFTRTSPRQEPRSQLCWVTPDASRMRCRTSPDTLRVEAVLAWIDEGTILAAISRGRRNGVARFHMDGTAFTVLEEDSLFDLSVTQDGRWIACNCGSPGQTVSEWRVFPLDNPDRVSRLPAHDSNGRYQIRWMAARRPMLPVERLTVTDPATPLMVGITHKLTATASDSAGRSISPGSLTWWSADKRIATVNDSTGVVRPLRPGTVMVRATVGGWRSDWVRLQVVAPTHRIVLRESWEGRLDTQWVPFGEPRPSISRGPGGVPGMLNGGDGSHESGVYSRLTIDGREGIGFEVRLSTPGSAVQYQRIILDLTPSLSDRSLAAWDHVTGYLPWDGDGSRCDLTYPAGDGPPELRSFAAGGLRPRASARIRSGAWYTVRLQTFPDGSCGMAIDGRPISRSAQKLRTGRNYRVVLMGASVGAHVLAGPLEVWQGVRTDVNWSELDRPQP